MGRLSGLDAAFLSLETPDRPMHLGAVADVPGTGRARPPAVAARGAGRAAAGAARRPAGWFPSWWPATDFDPRGHVHGYEVADQRTFEAYAAGWLATPLDLSRPPWDVHVVTGLPDERFAVLVKLHHSLADGAGAVALAGALLDGGSPPPRPTDPPDRPASARPRPWRARSRGPCAGRRCRRCSRPAARRRRVAFVRLDLADVRQIRRQHGGTTNDVALAVLAGGLREWLRTQGRTGRRPHAAGVDPGEHPRPRRSGGNQLSGYLCDLPVGIADPVDRLRAVRAAMDATRRPGRRGAPARCRSWRTCCRPRAPAVHGRWPVWRRRCCSTRSSRTCRCRRCR